MDSCVPAPYLLSGSDLLEYANRAEIDSAVTASGEDYEWTAAGRQLQEIALLQEGWDAEGADRPSRLAIEGAWTLLRRIFEGRSHAIPPKLARALTLFGRAPDALWPCPSRVVPARGGTIVLKWERHGKYLEVEIVDLTHIEVMLELLERATEHWEEAIKEELDLSPRLTLTQEQHFLPRSQLHTAVISSGSVV